MPEKPKKPQIVSLKKAKPPQTPETDPGSAPASDEDCEIDFGFGLGRMKTLADAVKKAEEIQKGAKELTEELDATRIEASDPGRSIIYRCKGNQEPISVAIKPEAMAYSAAELSERVLSVVLGGHRHSCNHMRSRMNDLVFGLRPDGVEEPPNIPPVEGVVAFVQDVRE